MDTPVLLLIFNRLEPAKQVLDAVRQVKPSKFYIAGDGVRQSRLNEFEKVQAVRQFILNNIDWDCDVKTLFRDENIGCKYAVYGALKWFFSHEEMGIILEDDCLPNSSFFWFCDELLNKYEHNDEIGMIGGRNDLGIYDSDPDSQYFFSTRGFIWGWATWRRVVDNFDVELGTDECPVNLLALAKNSSSWVEFFYRLDTIRKIRTHQVNSWAYPWNLNLLLNKRFAVVPSKNLIRNIGFSLEATHTTKTRQDDISLFDLSFPCFTSQEVKPNAGFTKRVILTQYGGTLKFLLTCALPRYQLKEFLKRFSFSKA